MVQKFFFRKTFKCIYLGMSACSYKKHSLFLKIWFPNTSKEQNLGRDFFSDHVQSGTQSILSAVPSLASFILRTK